MFMILYGFLITLVGYLCAKPLNRRFPQVPLFSFWYVHCDWFIVNLESSL